MPLKVSDGIGAWIKDFAKSDAPQFKGKNKEERRDMAVAAYLSAKRGPEKENVTHDQAMNAKRTAEMKTAMATFKKDVSEARAPRMKYALVGARDMKIYATNSDERDARMDRRSLEKRFKQPMKIARLKTAQTIGDKVDKSQIKESVIREAIDPKMNKVKQLARLGLVDKTDINKLVMAMKAMKDGKEVKPQNRKVIFDAFGDLIDLVTGDTQIFQKAKKAVKEAVDPADTGGAEETNMAMKQIKAMRHFLDGIEARVKETGDMEEWYQNKLTKANDYLKTLYSYGKGDSTNESVDISEAKLKIGDIVMLNKGPHKKVPHKVIAVDYGKKGRYNLQPVGLRARQIKYPLGMVSADGRELKKASPRQGGKDHRDHIDKGFRDMERAYRR